MTTLQWFTCLFAYNFDFEVLQRLWDVIFIRGNRALFSICLAIFCELEQPLLRCENIQEIIRVIDRIPKFFREPHHLLKLASDPRFNIPKSQLHMLRQKHRPEFIEELEHYKAINEKLPYDRVLFMNKFPLFKGLAASDIIPVNSRTVDLIPLISCDRSWPSCFLDCSQGQSQHEVFVFCVKDLSKSVRQNYFYPNESDSIAVFSDDEEVNNDTSQQDQNQAGEPIQ